jgi:hypothetical protein
LRPRHKPERVAHKRKVAGFQRRRDVGCLPLWRVEIFGGIEPSF